MNHQTWALINGPTGILNLLMNTFYISCMVRSTRGERIKQPLKCLLVSLIVSTILYPISICGVFHTEEKLENNRIAQFSLLISLCCTSSSISSSVWLNFFYYTQIVPAQRALFIWIKKNIKPVIFCILFTEQIYGLVDFTLVLLDFNLHGFGLNNSFPMDYFAVPVIGFVRFPGDFYILLNIMQKCHFYFNFTVMMMSSVATVLYLCRHMCRMVANGQSLSCPHLSSQVRVTVTGILQGLLYLAFATWQEYVSITQHFHSAFMIPYIRSTVISFYMLGVTFSLGVGQAVFRQRAADIWTKACHWCKACTVQPPE